MQNPPLFPQGGMPPVPLLGRFINGWQGFFMINNVFHIYKRKEGPLSYLKNFLFLELLFWRISIKATKFFQKSASNTEKIEIYINPEDILCLTNGTQ